MYGNGQRSASSDATAAAPVAVPGPVAVPLAWVASYLHSSAQAGLLKETGGCGCGCGCVMVGMHA